MLETINSHFVKCEILLFRLAYIFFLGSMKTRVEHFILVVNYEMISTVCKWNYHRGRQTPPKTSSHCYRECHFEVLLSEVVHAYHFWIQRRYLLQSFELSLIFLLVILDFSPEQFIFQSLEVFLVPKAW